MGKESKGDGNIIKGCKNGVITGDTQKRHPKTIFGNRRTAVTRVRMFDNLILPALKENKRASEVSLLLSVMGERLSEVLNP